MGYKTIEFKEASVFLVTGGAGFIGSNLCEALLKKGYFVRCLDDLSCGKQENVDLFINNPKYQFINGDIRTIDVCLNACEGVDYVLHQAAWGSVPKSIELPLLYEDINIKGTVNMMEAARRKKVKKFVFASSSSVYGNSPYLPNQEGREGAPLSPYAVTKSADELYGKLYHELYGLDTYGLRYFNVFGKRQDADDAYAAVIPRFMKQLIKNEQPVIYGDGNQSRDFTYIENVIEANLKACKAPHAAAGQVYNIAYGEKNTLYNIYQELCFALGKEIKPKFESERSGDIKNSYADINKAIKLLKYNPEWSFRRGIIESIEWYKETLS